MKLPLFIAGRLTLVIRRGLCQKVVSTLPPLMSAIGARTKIGNAAETYPIGGPMADVIEKQLASRKVRCDRFPSATITDATTKISRVAILLDQLERVSSGRQRCRSSSWYFS